MQHALLQWAESRDYEVGWTGAETIREVVADIEERRRDGELDVTFAHENLSFDAGPATRGDPWKALVIVTPRPAYIVRFVVGGRTIEAPLPPTYQRYRPLFEETRKELAETVLKGATVETLDVPLKLFAARLGLVRYGRNNITYSPTAGSYLQLFGYLTDADLPVEARRSLQAAMLMDECSDCGVCTALCPTSAIRDDRILLHVDRCLTLANETPGPWPSWVPPSAHNALIGCLACQRICPANPALPTADSGVVFDEAETDVLLAESGRTGPLWASIRRKLEVLGRSYDEEVVGRNLKAFLHARV